MIITKENGIRTLEAIAGKRMCWEIAKCEGAAGAMRLVVSFQL